MVPTVERDGPDLVGLVDRDGGRNAVDAVGAGPIHAIEELAGVGREGLDVAALPFGVHRVERERRLAGAAHAGDDDELAQGKVYVETLQVVLAGSADGESRPSAAGGGGGARLPLRALSRIARGRAPRAWVSSRGHAPPRRQPELSLYRAPVSGPVRGGPPPAASGPWSTSFPTGRRPSRPFESGSGTTTSRPSSSTFRPGEEGERGLGGLPGREAEFREGVDLALHYCRATGCPRLHAMWGVPGADTSLEESRPPSSPTSGKRPRGRPRPA